MCRQKSQHCVWLEESTTTMNSKSVSVKTNSQLQSDKDIESADRECFGSCFAYSCYFVTYILMCCCGRDTDELEVQ